MRSMMDLAGTSVGASACKRMSTKCGFGGATPPAGPATFEELCRDRFAECMRLVDACLKNARAKPDAIQTVLLVGGSANIPCFETRLRAKFPAAEIDQLEHKEHIVAMGAAVHARSLAGGSIG